jgi:hypothetical protein
MRRTAIALVALVLVQPHAFAFSQDMDLESALRRSDPRALALFPAIGYKDGVAGFFRNHSLYVVPHSERAWCHEQTRGILKPGCYVEFFFQLKGHKANSANGSPCGLSGRWHQAAAGKTYGPTPGAFYSIAMASGDWEAVILALEDRHPGVRLSDYRRSDECGSKSEK